MNDEVPKGLHWPQARAAGRVFHYAAVTRGRPTWITCTVCMFVCAGRVKFGKRKTKRVVQIVATPFECNQTWNVTLSHGWLVARLNLCTWMYYTQTKKNLERTQRKEDKQITYDSHGRDTLF